MSPALLLDLDQTLSDTSSLEALRKAGNWTGAYAGIPNLKPYPPLTELIEQCRAAGIKVIVITVSPSGYCSRVISQLKHQIDGSICYHDVRPNIKPHPAAFQKAIKDYDLDPQKIISAGDSAKDIIASHAAGIPAIACLWATAEQEALLATEPEYQAESPEEMANHVRGFFGI